MQRRNDPTALRLGPLGVLGVLGFLGLLGVSLMTIAGCGGDDQPDPERPQIANPASEFCVAQGGEVDIVEEDGGEVGYCVLPDGTRVDEWSYFREHNPEP